MSNFVKWCFALPLTYVLYFVLSILLPVNGMVASAIRYAVMIEVFLVICKKFLNFDIDFSSIKTEKSSHSNVSLQVSSLWREYSAYLQSDVCF